MTSKSKSERLKRLISHGFFAPELPPCFVSHDLAKHRKGILAALNALPSEKGRAKPIERHVTEPAWFYFPRFGKNDRKHGVINPTSYLLIADSIASNFVAIRNITKRSKISSSPLLFDWSGSRAFVRPSIDLRDDFRLDLASREEEYVEADIRAFFHSIYTHAIPWAIYGKSWAKVNRSNDHFGNLLDLYCRNAQGGQTIGLPVGPDTSRVIAELIASAIDASLRNKLKINSKCASRYIDDYTIRASEGETSEVVIAMIRQSLSEFELELNADKTLVVLTSARLDAGWKALIRTKIPIAKSSQSEFQQFFYEIGRLCNDLPAHNIEKYALLNARYAIITSRNWPVVQKYLINAYRRNSTILPLLVEMIITRQVESRDIEKNSIESFINNRIPILARENRTGEVIWLLFLTIRLKLQLNAKSGKEISGIVNSFVALLSVVADKNGLFDARIDPKHWDEYLTKDGLRSPMWLYAYESVVGGFRTGVSHSFVEKDPFFGPLYDRKVRFLDVEEGFKSFKGAMKSLRRANQMTQKMRDDFNDDFVFDDDEYENNHDEIEDDDQIY